MREGRRSEVGRRKEEEVGKWRSGRKEGEKVVKKSFDGSL